MKYIMSELEEMEREETFRLKRFKELKIKRAKAAEPKVVKKKAQEKVDAEAEHDKKEARKLKHASIDEEVKVKEEKPPEEVPVVVKETEKIGEPRDEEKKKKHEPREEEKKKIPEPRKEEFKDVKEKIEEEMDENLYDRVFDDTFPKIIKDERMYESLVHTNICACCLSLFEVDEDTDQVICPLCQLEAKAKEKNQDITLNVVPCDSAYQKPTENVKRLEHLMNHITEVIDLAEQYKSEGITSLSMDNFIKTCSAVKCKIEDITGNAPSAPRPPRSPSVRSTPPAAPAAARAPGHAPVPPCDCAVEAKPKSKPSSVVSSRAASAASTPISTRPSSIRERPTDELSETYRLTPVQDPKLGYFETKFKEIVKVTRLKNPDGTICEEKQVITIRTERRNPKTGNDDVQPCIGAGPMSESGGGGGGYGGRGGYGGGGGYGGTGGGSGGICKLCASGSGVGSGGGTSVSIRGSGTGRSGRSRGRKVCGGSDSMPCDATSVDREDSIPCDSSICGTASIAFSSKDPSVCRGASTPKSCDNLSICGTGSMPIPCVDPTICRAGRPIPCSDTNICGGGSVPMPCSDASVRGKGSAPKPCDNSSVCASAGATAASHTPTVCSAHTPSRGASVCKAGSGAVPCGGASVCRAGSAAVPSGGTSVSKVSSWAVSCGGFGVCGARSEPVPSRGPNVCIPGKAVVPGGGVCQGDSTADLSHGINICVGGGTQGKDGPGVCGVQSKQMPTTCSDVGGYDQKMTGFGSICPTCKQSTERSADLNAYPPTETRSEASHRSPAMGELKLRPCMSAGYQNGATSEASIGVDGTCECYRNTKQHPPSLKLEVPAPFATSTCKSTSVDSQLCCPKYSTSMYSITCPYDAKVNVKVTSSKSVQTCEANIRGKNTSDKATSCIPNCAGMMGRQDKHSEHKCVNTELRNKEVCTSSTRLDCVPRRRQARSPSPTPSCNSKCSKRRGKLSTSSCTIKIISRPPKVCSFERKDDDSEVILKGSMLSVLRKIILPSNKSIQCNVQNEDVKILCPNCASKFSKVKSKVNHTYYTCRSKNDIEKEEEFVKEFCSSCGTIGKYSSTSASASYKSAAAGSNVTNSSSAVYCCQRNAQSKKSSDTSVFSDYKPTFHSLAQALRSSTVSCPANKTSEICCPKNKPWYQTLEIEPSIIKQDATTSTKRSDRFDCRPLKGFSRVHACEKIRTEACACHSDSHMLRYRNQCCPPIPQSQSCCDNDCYYNKR